MGHDTSSTINNIINMSSTQEAVAGTVRAIKVIVKNLSWPYRAESCKTKNLPNLRSRSYTMVVGGTYGSDSSAKTISFAVETATMKRKKISKVLPAFTYYTTSRKYCKFIVWTIVPYC